MSVPNRAPSSVEPIGVTIVVPCFNEVAGLRHLQTKLQSATSRLKHGYRVEIVLVDDGSDDGTWDLMQNLFANLPRVILVRHSSNRGIGAAIVTGIRAASTEIICSIDADCSYDPCELERLIPLLAPTVDLVTASPYHPDGKVVGVAGWRLLLSKAASFLYGQILRLELHTYTSCFRVYRRSSISKLNLRHHDFLAMAESIGRLSLQGGVVVECPATLTTRLYGNSKMKTARVLLRHLNLMVELFTLKVRQTLFGGLPPVVRPFSPNEN